MIPPDDDRDLRDHFASLREENGSAAPEFGRLVDEARGRPARPSTTGRRLAWAATTATVALAAILVLRPSRGPEEPSLNDAIAMARAISSWIPPTDVFVEISGVKAPEGVPGLEFTSLALPGTLAPEAADSHNPTP